MRMIEEVNATLTASLTSSRRQHSAFIENKGLMNRYVKDMQLTRGKAESIFGEILRARPQLREQIVIQSKCCIC